MSEEHACAGRCRHEVLLGGKYIFRTVCVITKFANGNLGFQFSLLPTKRESWITNGSLGFRFTLQNARLCKKSKSYVEKFAFSKEISVKN